MAAILFCLWDKYAGRLVLSSEEGYLDLAAQAEQRSDFTRGDYEWLLELSNGTRPPDDWAYYVTQEPVTSVVPASTMITEDR